MLLNHASAGLWPGPTWLYKTAFVHDMGMCMCVCVCVPRLCVIIGMILRLVKQTLQLLYGSYSQY